MDERSLAVGVRGKDGERLMFVYEKKLQYPVNIKNPNPALAKFIISQYGGPDGELGASLRYLSQRYSMPYPELKALLTDIGTSDSEMYFCYLTVPRISGCSSGDVRLNFKALSNCSAAAGTSFSSDVCSMAITSPLPQ
jgi:hypothetical protein